MYDKQTEQHAHYSREGRKLAAIHKDRLRKDLTKYNIEHGSTGKTETQCKSETADISEKITEERTNDGRCSLKRCNKDCL